MDIFKQNRYLWITVIVLLIMNFAALTLLWVGRPEGPRPNRGPYNRLDKQNRTKELLEKELGFDEKQTKQYLKLRQQHQDQMRLLEREIRQIKKQMFDEVLHDNHQNELSDSLLALAQEKQAQIEQITFQHFLDLKRLCKPDQQDKLKLLMRQVFRQGPAQRRPDAERPGPPPPRP
ncbi:MAG: periplasmic heavy metal sensor [Calditrichaeota bacterium]|nr:MAG: hypothetical protein DWQ03_08335 [Calditrichota bacterium]MBL1207027.1 periplasmic heavy metal sensor [Calditrichota bacterium]NOG46854.1 periplasmic heavy metal sensor [Calditrichota bacterium]